MRKYEADAIADTINRERISNSYISDEAAAGSCGRALSRLTQSLADQLLRSASWDIKKFDRKRFVERAGFPLV